MPILATLPLPPTAFFSHSFHHRARCHKIQKLQEMLFRVARYRNTKIEMMMFTRRETMMKSITRTGLASILLVIVTLRAVVSQSIGNYLDVLSNSPEFSQLKAFAAVSGLEEVLLGDGSSRTTFFAPTDTAFSTGSVVMTNLLLEEWNFHFQSLLLYHIAGQEIVFNQLVDGSTLESLIDEPIGVSVVDGRVLLNGAATIVEGDILATNGVIHAIDNILAPSWYTRTVLDVLISDGDRFSTFLGLDTIGFLNETNFSPGPYTLFAPLGSDLDVLGLASRTSDPTGFLRNVLGYHLVSGIYTGSDLLQLTELGTFSEEYTLNIEQSEDRRSLTVNGQALVQSDILTNNGVVHVIAGVLLPLVDPEMEECLFWKATEETLGLATGVQCICSVIDPTTIELTCTEGEGLVCAPKYALCSDSVSCCSTSRRRCFAGQCRDDSSERVKLGQGGTEGRTAGRNSGRNLRISGW